MILSQVVSLWRPIYASLLMTVLCDDPLPEIKTKVVTDGEKLIAPIFSDHAHL